METTRKLLIHPDRNGYVYVIDRTTGAVLSADAFTNRERDERS